MNKFGEKTRQLREQKGWLLRQAASLLDIDTGLLSKIERGERRAGRDLLDKMVLIYDIPEKELLVPYLSDKVFAYLQDEEYAMEALQVAEASVRYFHKEKSLDKLLEEIDEIRHKLQGLRPLPREQVSNLQQYYKVEYTFESNRIEGNTLNHMETALVVEKGMTIDGKSLQEHLEAINHADAVDFITSLVSNEFVVDERIIKDIHSLVLRGIQKENAGRYRRIDVRISGSKHIPPPHYTLSEKMEGLMSYYEQQASRLHPVLLAADMHEILVKIHPFTDGNGRTSRLLMNLILLNNGYTIANLKGDLTSRLNYYNALEHAHVYHDNAPFRHLIAMETRRSMEEYYKIVSGQE